jgi:hypothetical protein
VQTIIAAAAEGSLGARDARRLARHVAHCQPCRREALGSGLDRELIARQPLRRRVAAKVAAWLPLPAFLRARRGGGPGDDGGAVSGGSAAWASHLPAVSDQLSAGWTKVAAGVAVLLAGVGAGVGMKHGVPAHATPATRARSASAPAGASAAAATAAGKPAARYAGDARARSLRPAGRSRAAQTATVGLSGSSAPQASVPQVRRSAPATAGGGAARQPATRSRRTAAGPTGAPRVQPPAPTLPRTTVKPVQTVQHAAQQVGQTVNKTVAPVTQTVTKTVSPVVPTVKKTVDDVTGAVGGAATGPLPVVP